MSFFIKTDSNLLVPRHVYKKKRKVMVHHRNRVEEGVVVGWKPKTVLIKLIDTEEVIETARQNMFLR